MRNRRAAAATIAVDSPGRTRSLVVTAAILSAGLVAVSCWVTPDAYESFRIPQELAFRAEAILLLLTGAFAATAPRFEWRAAAGRISRVEWLLCAVVLGWMIVTTLTSTNPLLSRSSVVTAFGAVVIYLASRGVAPRLPLAALAFCCIPAIVNAAITILQETRVWDPFGGSSQRFRYASTGLLGNPNYVGTFLSGAAVAAIVAAVVLRGKRRWLYGAIAVFLGAGILASSTRTAVIACTAGLVVFGLMRPWRQALVIALFLAAGIGFVLIPGTRVGSGFRQLFRAARHRQWEVVSSERLVPALTAIEMIKAHPLVGVGPGCFGFHYMDARVALRDEYPAAFLQSYPQNWGEVHDDHLQVMCETGLPGYAIYLAAVVAFIVPALRRRTVDASLPARKRFARTLRVPLATTFFVICIAQFPLEVAASRVMFLTLAAVVNGWDES